MGRILKFSNILASLHFELLITVNIIKIEIALYSLEEFCNLSNGTIKHFITLLDVARVKCIQ